MKKNTIVIFLICVLFIILLVICSIVSSHISYKKEVSLGEKFTVPLNKMVIVKDENLKIKLVSSSDSRCGEGMQCIWQGELNYTITVNGDSIELGTVNNKQVEYKEYTISLNNNDSDKYVNLKIEK